MRRIQAYRPGPALGAWGEYQAMAECRPAWDGTVFDAARVAVPCRRGRVVRRALEGVNEREEVWPGPSGFAASLPDLVAHLVVDVDGEDVGFAVPVAGFDAQELAGRVVGHGDGLMLPFAGELT